MNIKRWIALGLTTIVLTACGGGYDTQSSSAAVAAADAGGLFT